MDIIKTNGKGSLIVISGPTCAGKGTICRELLSRNNNIWRSISYTSRPMRGNEVDGVDYYFVTKEEFEEKINNGEMLEYAQVHYNDYYGTPKSHIKEKLDQGIDVILERYTSSILSTRHFSEIIIDSTFLTASSKSSLTTT